MLERMFELEGSSPDVLDVDDVAVRRCEPAVRVWVDVAALTQQRERGRSSSRRGGIFIGGLVRGVMWARVMSNRGMWLGVITCELERDGGPVMTAPALVPEWAVTRRLPGSERRTYGKASNRPTAQQRANQPPS
jgi:hypothetical protein